MGSPTVRGIIHSSTWHVGIALFHYFMHRLLPFPWQYQSYTTLCMCAWVRLRNFPRFSSVSPVFSLFFSIFLLSFLPLVFLPLFPSLKLSPLLFIQHVLTYCLPITPPYLLLSFPLYACFYIINADIRTWHLAPFHPNVLLFDRSRTACR
jgi:hypothetical protein